MRDKTPTQFGGFEHPRSNYYRLSNTWFELWIWVRAALGTPRVLSLLKFTEYLLRHTWGWRDFEGFVHLTLDEFEQGRRVKRRPDGQWHRLDQGTGLSRSAITAAAKLAKRMGLVEKQVDKTDRARIHCEYRPRLCASPDQDQEADGDAFEGFPDPESNYFKVSVMWLSLLAGLRSEVLILAVEYLFRHTWGWQDDKVRWLTADEIANGRQRLDGTRYDPGIGYAVDTVRRACETGVTKELLVWRPRNRNGQREQREYTLRRQGMAPGRWQLPEDTDDNGPLDDDIEHLTDDDDELRSDDSRPLTDDSGFPTDDAKPLPDANGQRTLEDTSQDTGSTHQQEETPTTHPAGAVGFDPDEIPSVPQLYHSPWDGHQPLAADEVLLYEPGQDKAFVLSLGAAARALVDYVIQEQDIFWSVEHWRDDGSDEWTADELRRQQWVYDLVAKIRKRRQDWGHHNLITALAQIDISREDAEYWIGRCGAAMVRGWLVYVRRQRRAKNPAGLLIHKLQRGETPPGGFADL